MQNISRKYFICTFVWSSLLFLSPGSMCLLSVSSYSEYNTHECVQHAEYCVSHPQSPCHSKQAVQHLATGQGCKHQSDEPHCDTEKHSPPDRETGTVHLRDMQTDTLFKAETHLTACQSQTKNMWRECKYTRKGLQA